MLPLIFTVFYMDLDIYRQIQGKTMSPQLLKINHLETFAFSSLISSKRTLKVNALFLAQQFNSTWRKP